MAEGYASWSAVIAAIKAQAKKDLAGGRTAHDLNALLVQARFDRFLSRVFADGADSEWMLKGGGAMLARVPHARGTKDLDLAATAADLNEAVAALERRVAADLGDHIRFELVKTTETGLGDNQPGVLTRKAHFMAYDADTGKKIGDIPVDIVVGPAPVGRPEVVDPVNRIDLPRPLVAHPFRLYPLADQVAEKVCATLSTYGGASSSRAKDLVDLVVIAQTQRLDARELQLAIDAKRPLSNIEQVHEFTVPASWTSRYGVLARATAHTGSAAELDAAQRLVASMVDPALSPDPAPAGVTWVPGRGWLPDAAEDADRASAGETPSRAGTVWVRQHVRAGWPVREHNRSPRST